VGRERLSGAVYVPGGFPLRVCAAGELDRRCLKMAYDKVESATCLRKCGIGRRTTRLRGLKRLPSSWVKLAREGWPE
jgi:hypothetical protein